MKDKLMEPKPTGTIYCSPRISSGFTPGASCCSPAQSSCCSPSPEQDSEHEREAVSFGKKVNIQFLYLDLSKCTRCQGTEKVLEEAVSDVARVLEAAGVEVKVEKIQVKDENQALELGFVSSPTIRINGRDIQLEVIESPCEPCSDLSGENVNCRVWLWEGKEYPVPPKAMIIDAILREVYGPQPHTPEKSKPVSEVPENLKRFLRSRGVPPKCC